jgi:hypothetical protein
MARGTELLVRAKKKSKSKNEKKQRKNKKFCMGVSP